MSTVKANDLQTTTGGIPTVKGQKLIPTAWVNFNGTGTVAIRDSENVSSIGDRGTGKYTVNFTTTMANANYSVVTAGSNAATFGADAPSQGPSYEASTTTKVHITTGSNTTTSYDWDEVSVAILGGQA